ncbi:MAG TPA: YciI family protein [Kofleriaceae bacterium]|jgi:hypothetical protein
MQYLLMIYDDEKVLGSKTPEDRAKVSAEYLKYTQEIKASGHFLGGDALQGSHTATTVRVRDGKQTTTDGPFAETREVLGGYYLVEAANLDEAIKLAARIPSSRWGSIEVRPIWAIPEMGPKS